MIALFLLCLALATVAFCAAALVNCSASVTSESDQSSQQLTGGSSDADSDSSPPLIERRTRSSALFKLPPRSSIERRHRFEANPVRANQPVPLNWHSPSPNRVNHSIQPPQYYTRSSPTPSHPPESPRRFQSTFSHRRAPSPISSTFERYVPPPTSARQEPAFKPQQQFYQHPQTSTSAYNPSPATLIPVPDSHDATPPPPVPAHNSLPPPITFEYQPTPLETRYQPWISTSSSLLFHENIDMEDVQETSVTSVAPAFVASASPLEGSCVAYEQRIYERSVPESERMSLFNMDVVDEASPTSDWSDEDEDMTDQDDLMTICYDYPVPADEPVSASPPFVPFSYPIAPPSSFDQSSFQPTSYPSMVIADTQPTSLFSSFAGLAHFPNATPAPPPPPPQPVPSFLPSAFVHPSLFPSAYSSNAFPESSPTSLLSYSEGLAPIANAPPTTPPDPVPSFLASGFAQPSVLTTSYSSNALPESSPTSLLSSSEGLAPIANASPATPPNPDPSSLPSAFAQPSIVPNSYSSNAFPEYSSTSLFSSSAGLAPFPNAPPATPPDPAPSSLPSAFSQLSVLPTSYSSNALPESPPTSLLSSSEGLAPIANASPATPPDPAPSSLPSAFAQLSVLPTSESSNLVPENPATSPLTSSEGLAASANDPPATPPNPVPSFLPIDPVSPTSFATPFYSPLNNTSPFTSSPESPLTAFSAFASGGPSTFATFVTPDTPPPSPPGTLHSGLASTTTRKVPAWAARPAPSGTPAASSIPPPSTSRPMLDPRRAVRSMTAFVTNVPIVSSFAAPDASPTPLTTPKVAPPPPPQVETEPTEPDFNTGDDDATPVVELSGDEGDEQEGSEEEGEEEDENEEEEGPYMTPSLDIFGELDDDEED
ncbi:hypothetical protein RQP46_007043 [Phenoliferia psychrophenolica]